MKTRDYNIDLLRIVASFMVVVIHVAAYRWSLVSVQSSEWQWYNFYDSIVRSAVPIFIMISGAFFLYEKKENNLKTLFSKYILKLIIIYFVWSFIYAMYELVSAGNFNITMDTIKWFLERLISGPFHLWYIPVLIGLYILSPLLKQMVTHSSDQLLKYGAILFGISIFLNTLTWCDFLPFSHWIKLIISKIPIHLVCQFYSYYILGYYLYRRYQGGKSLKGIYVGGVLSVIACIGITSWVSLRQGSGFISFYNEFSLTTLLEGVALFLYFKNSKKISHWIEGKEKIISTLSSSTLGIYLIHVLVMNLLFRGTMFSVTNEAIPTILAVPLLSILIFLISLGVVYRLKKIPKINSYLV